MWVPPEDGDPVVRPAPTRKSVACFGAVSLRNGRFVHAFSPRFSAATFEAFLKQLLRRRPGIESGWCSWTTRDIIMPSSESTSAA